jgi:hypothetical protein
VVLKLHSVRHFIIKFVIHSFIQWKLELFEALDYIHGQITRRFDQEDLAVAVARENLLSNADLTDVNLATSKLPNNRLPVINCVASYSSFTTCVRARAGIFLFRQ